LYEFGPFRLNPQKRQLLHGDEPVPLAPKAFDTLLVLVENSGRVVSKDDLLKTVWPDSFVEEANLSQNIYTLRKTLGDSPDQRNYIATIPGQGYQFTEKVRLLTAETQEELVVESHSRTQVVIEETQEADENRPVIQTVFKGASFIFLGLLAILAALSFQFVSPANDPKLVRMTPITYVGRAEPFGGIHIDGSRVYFSERRGNSWPLMQTSLTGGEAVAVAAPFPNTRIFDLSPDGSQFLIGSFSDRSGNMPLWTMPAQGGAPRRVGDIVVDDAAWFPDGQHILCSRNQEVFSVESDGGKRHHLFSVEGSVEEFSWHPDGRVFRFTVDGPKGDSSLWEASVQDGHVHSLLPDWPSPHAECCGAWMPNGKDYVFSAVRNNHKDVWVLREPEGLWGSRRKRAIQITSGPYDYSEPVPTRDGKKLVVFAIQYGGQTLRFNRQQGEFVPFVTSGQGFTFSRDGEWMAYIGGSDQGLWRSKSDGSERVELMPGRLWPRNPRWSPDGKRILFTAGAPGSRRANYIISRDGGASSPVANDVYSRVNDWMPDGESAISDSLDDAGSSKGMLVVQLNNGARTEVPGSSGMVFPRVSPDGRYLAAKSEDDKTLRLYDFRTRRWSDLAKGKVFTRHDWSTDSRYLYFQDVLDPGGAVFRWDSETGRIERAFDFSKLLLQGSIIRCGFDGFAPDGSYLTNVLSNVSNLQALDVDLR
jgi:DNA-binding winged helix-turn-helix (wHTH) protein/Tol biopolymer transport system component